MAKVIGIMNQKGGVGKTTTAISLATGFGKLGKKSLLIDTDSQCNSTDTYGANTKDTQTLYDLIFEGEKVDNCIQKTSVGNIIPCDHLMRDAEQRFPNDNSRSFLLSEACKDLNDKFDYIIIDTPPTMGVILSNVLTYADEIIIPMTCDRYGLMGTDELFRTIDAAKKYTNPKLKIAGILLVKYNDRLNICRDIKNGLIEISDSIETKVFDTTINESVACRESQSSKKSIYEYAPKSKTAKDYMSLCNELMKEWDSNGEK